jgi:hypothetical protein
MSRWWYLIAPLFHTLVNHTNRARPRPPELEACRISKLRWRHIALPLLIIAALVNLSALLIQF